jgi:NAD-dependent deacetylase
MKLSYSEQIDLARTWVKEATSIVVLTGAGISAESGVPTFRGEEGLWKSYSPEELANPDAFQRDPKLVWEWYDWRRGLVAETEPNPAHDALVRMESSIGSFALITQNVDGLHDRAGSKNIMKLHGDIWWVRCLSCGRVSENREVPLRHLPPKCDCGGLLRPDIVWFGEALALEVMDSAWSRASEADVFLVIGTSALVQPAASLPFRAKEHGARVIEINVEQTVITPYADISLIGKAADLLPQLII